MSWLKSPLKLFFLIFILIGLVLRFYNLNYDNLWFDEIATFWVSESSINFSDVVSRNIQIEGSLFIYNFVVYFLNNLFGYDPTNIRIYSAIFGALSIIVFFFLSKNILKSHKACFVATSLFSLNVFLIKYSQEGRMYAFLVLMCLLSIFFIIKILKEEEKNKIFSKYLIFFFIFQTIASFTSPFAIIILGSFLFILFLQYFFDKKNLNLFLIVFAYLIFTLFLYYFWSKNFNYEYSAWLVNPEIKFFTDFYFSSFFGSRLLGIIHLLLLIGFIIRFRKLIFHHLNEKTFLIYLIFFTYSIPLVFGYLVSPIINARYIIFVLIAVLILLPYFVFEINNIKLKNFFIILLLGINFFNHFSESNFKQFYEDRQKYKPNFEEAIEYIENTDTKNYTFVVKSGPNDVNYTYSKPLFHYINYIVAKKNLSLEGQTFQNFLASEEKEIWLISMSFPFWPYDDLVNKNNLKLVEKIDFPSLQIIKLKK